MLLDWHLARQVFRSNETSLRLWWGLGLTELAVVPKAGRHEGVDWLVKWSRYRPWHYFASNGVRICLRCAVTWCRHHELDQENGPVWKHDFVGMLRSDVATVVPEEGPCAFCLNPLQYCGPVLGTTCQEIWVFFSHNETTILNAFVHTTELNSWYY